MDDVVAFLVAHDRLLTIGDYDIAVILRIRKDLLHAAGWENVPAFDLPLSGAWVPVFGLRAASTRFIVREWVAGRDVYPLDSHEAVEEVRSMFNG